jgi:hypothetical protein
LEYAGKITIQSHLSRSFAIFGEQRDLEFEVIDESKI